MESVGRSLRHLLHLAKRFFGSLSRAEPPADDEAWALSQLLVSEQTIWRRMDAPDRRHAIGVAGAVAKELGVKATRPVLAAALLHDSGKVDSGLGTFARAGATLWSAGIGRAKASQGEGRVARYLRHDAIGRDLLTTAGSDPLTAAWAGEHHLPATQWTVPMAIARVLKACDDD